MTAAVFRAAGVPCSSRNSTTGRSQIVANKIVYFVAFSGDVPGVLPELMSHSPVSFPRSASVRSAVRGSPRQIPSAHRRPRAIAEVTDGAARTLTPSGLSGVAFNVHYVVGRLGSRRRGIRQLVVLAALIIVDHAFKQCAAKAMVAPPVIWPSTMVGLISLPLSRTIT